MAPIPGKTPTADTPISILLPAHNAAPFVEQAVRSTLAQTHKRFELLAIDDGSTDETLQILNKLAREDDRVRIISHENMGMGRSLNHALGEARFEWIARMDADDVMLPNRLERQLAFLAANPGVFLTSALVHYIDESGRTLGRNSSDYTNFENIDRMLNTNRPIGFHHPSVMMRKDVVLGAGGYRPEFWPCDDMDLWNRILEKYPRGVLVQPEYLMCYRIHEQSICVSAARRVCQKEEWVRECLVCRRQNRPEPNWEQYQASLEHAPLLTRLGRTRREWARTSYKLATLHFSQTRLLRLIPLLLVAGLLEPRFVLHRLMPQLRSGARWPAI